MILSNLNEWFIIPLIGGIVFVLLGFIAVVVSIKKKKSINPYGYLYLIGGLIIFLISYNKFHT